MAVRVTMAEVEEIIDIDSSITNIDAFITAANLTINSKLADITYTNEDGDDTTEATKKEIERWLSAHFVSIRDTRRSREKAGPVEESFQHKLGLNLQVTMYGQSCLMIDTSGTLLAMSKSSGGGDVGIWCIKPDLYEVRDD